MTALLSISADSKTVKGEKLGYLTAVQYLLPGKLSGVEFCPNRTKECFAVCLGEHSGRMPMKANKNARAVRSELWNTDKPAYWQKLRKELASFVRKAERAGLLAAYRPNGSSDIHWENYDEFLQIMSDFPTITVYDYTKALPHERTRVQGYDLTYSYTGEESEAELNEKVASGRLAIVFSTKKGEALPV